MALCRFCGQENMPNKVKIDEIIRTRYQDVFGCEILSLKVAEAVCEPCNEDLERAVMFKELVRGCEEKLFGMQEMLKVEQDEEELVYEEEYLDEIVERMDEKIETKTCTICNQAFVDLNSHILERHTTAKNCHLCFKSIPEKIFDVHLLTHRDPPIFTDEEKTRFKKFYCEVCNIFVLRTSCHIKSVHQKSDWVCEVCGAKCGSHASFYQHRALHHKDMFECDLCGKKFSIKNRIKAHMENIHATKKIACQLCGRRFGNARGLGKHMKKVHVDKTEQCEYCDMKFKTVYLKRQHERGVHLRDVHFVCGVCGATFNNATSMYRHNAKGHKELYHCFCGIDFLSKTKYRQHQDVEHYNSKLEKFVCFCEAHFKLVADFNIHLKNVHKLQILKTVNS